MTVPVVKLLLQQHPGLHLTFVSDPFMKPMFDGIERLEFVGANTKKDYKGISGLFRLSRELSRLHAFEAVADLHNVLRTKILRFFLTGIKKAAIDKGRAEKKELTRPVNKKLRQLKTGFQRYADVFAELGWQVDLEADYANRPKPLPGLVPGVEHKNITGNAAATGAVNDRTAKKLVGIAPFARHLPKMYPLDKMREVAVLLSTRSNSQVILFGSRSESEILEGWSAPGIYSVAGKLSFTEELNLISQLDLMISMDSANMHLASLYGVPVISIWGGTHPFLGFYGWRQSMQNAIQLDLPCRPSSVFGNKPCPVHGEQGCMEGITPEQITQHAILLLFIKVFEDWAARDRTGVQ
ncbi:MAG: glycosyltransferase family 9 protein [Chitinophagaceae bacterium]|nr:MAG: glycosyltransferase family 9 protein [Chitinophagaceae bacterium]